MYKCRRVVLTFGALGFIVRAAFLMGQTAVVTLAHVASVELQAAAVLAAGF